MDGEPIKVETMYSKYFWKKVNVSDAVSCKIGFDALINETAWTVGEVPTFNMIISGFKYNNVFNEKSEHFFIDVMTLDELRTLRNTINECLRANRNKKGGEDVQD